MIAPSLQSNHIFTNIFAKCVPPLLLSDDIAKLVLPESLCQANKREMLADYAMPVAVITFRCSADLQKDASGASAASGTYWPMQKFLAGNNKKF